MLSSVATLLVAFVINASGVQASILPPSGQNVDVNKYRLPANSDYVQSLEAPRRPGATTTSTDYVKAATAFVQTTAPGATFRLVGDHYVGADGIGHVYFKQTAHGLDIDNADFNVNVSVIVWICGLIANMRFVLP
jgi:extracellular elastinolytic metalloproteinase